jgi:predicted transposase/invertase (TIGR01784 family)
LNVDELKAFRYSMRFRYIDERQLALDCAVEEATVVAHKQGVAKVAKAMLVDGLDPARVARITKLSLKQIRAIRSA